MRCRLKTANLIEEMMEARVGIEPTNEGFADLSLPTWVPRQVKQYSETKFSFQPRTASLRAPFALK
jgi:hypothetical protein